MIHQRNSQPTEGLEAGIKKLRLDRREVALTRVRSEREHRVTCESRLELYMLIIS